MHTVLCAEPYTIQLMNLFAIICCRSLVLLQVYISLYTSVCVNQVFLFNKFYFAHQAKMQKFTPAVVDLCGGVMGEYGFGSNDIMRGIIEIQVRIYLYY